MEPQQPTQAPAPSATPVTQEYKYAGFWIRWVAAMVDSVILIVPTLLVQFTVPKEIDWLVIMIVSFSYYIWMTHSKQATLGKMLVGIKVQSVEGVPLTLGFITLRETVGKFISGIILGIGYIIAAFTKKKQGLHDFIAKSVVVYKDPTKPHTAGLIIGIIIAVILPIIAIFGILSSVVLVSLNVAREKGRDAQIVSLLMSIRPAAELYMMDNKSYGQIDNCYGGVFANPNISNYITTLKQTNASNANFKLSCIADGQNYAVAASLNEENTYYCVDALAYAGKGELVNDEKGPHCEDKVSI